MTIEEKIDEDYNVRIDNIDKLVKYYRRFKEQLIEGDERERKLNI